MILTKFDFRYFKNYVKSLFGKLVTQELFVEHSWTDEILNPYQVCTELIELWIIQLSRHTHNSFKELRDLEIDRLREYYDDFVWILEQEREEQERQIKAAQRKG